MKNFLFQNIIIGALSMLCINAYAQIQSLHFPTNIISNNFIKIDSVVGLGLKPDKSTFIATKNIWKYNENHELEEECSYITNENFELTPKVQRKNYTDVEGRIFRSVFSEWDNDIDQFFAFMKYEYNYDEDENGYVAIRYKRDSTDNWICQDSMHIQFFYNQKKNTVETSLETFKNGDWTDSIKETYSFDEEKRITQKIVQKWGNNFYQNYQKFDFSYKGNKATVTESMWNGLAWESISYTLGDVDFSIKKTLYYNNISEHKSGKEKSKKEDGFYINAGKATATVSIYNSKGKLLHSQKITGTSYIHVGRYGKGIFDIKISMNGRSVTRQFLVE